MSYIEFIHTLPKAERHLHLEGALPWSEIRKRSDNALPKTPLWWDDNFRFSDFTDFLQNMRICIENRLLNVDDYHLAARQIFRRLAKQNVRYVEISFGARHPVNAGIPLNDIATAVKEAAPDNLTTIVYCGLNREASIEDSQRFAAAIFAANQIDGIDLHGDETRQTPHPFVNIFAEAQERNLLIKAHAGELMGAQSVWDALDFLGVRQIEHGTTAVTDSNLLNRLAREDITVDMCVSSNVKLRVVDNVKQHPIRQFLQRGINVTINTDDPTLFGKSLTEEMYLLVEKLDFTLPELAQLQTNAFRTAAMPESQRQAILQEIETITRQHTTVGLFTKPFAMNRYAVGLG